MTSKEVTAVDGMLRRLSELSRPESLRLLASVSYGRIVFTELALPAVRPVNHVIADNAVLISTDLGMSALSRAGVVVAYEADAIDPVQRLGWSVIVTGVAQVVQDPDEAVRYRLLLRPWTSEPNDHIIRIYPELVTGFEMVAASAARQAG
jgi:nitroimidazol reductase NimA-like FMN-containing flavoprotein (pyridoxamine 5'-phosphate oxidase superfamily)